jgi:hypothetical protein
MRPIQQQHLSLYVKRAGGVLENLKLGCVSSKDSSDTDTDTDTDTDAIDIGIIPDTLTDKSFFYRPFPWF